MALHSIARVRHAEARISCGKNSDAMIAAPVMAVIQKFSGADSDSERLHTVRAPRHSIQPAAIADTGSAFPCAQHALHTAAGYRRFCQIARGAHT